MQVYFVPLQAISPENVLSRPFDAEIVSQKTKNNKSDPKAGLMEKRIGTISIVIRERKMAEKVNKLISDYGDYVLARQGLPFPEREIFIITLIVEAPMDEINALTGSLGRLEHTEVKSILSKIKIA